MVEIVPSKVPKTFPELYACLLAKVNAQGDISPKPFWEIAEYTSVSAPPCAPQHDVRVRPFKGAGAN